MLERWRIQPNYKSVKVRLPDSIPIEILMINWEFRIRSKFLGIFINDFKFGIELGSRTFTDKKFGVKIERMVVYFMHSSKLKVL